VIRFETRVHIDRPQDDVFASLTDPETYPYLNSAVKSVRRIADENGARRYQLERELRSGRAENVLEVVSASPPTEVLIRTTDRPTPFTYRYRLRRDRGGTDVSLDADVELDGIPRGLTGLAACAVKRGVDENLATLKRLLEHARRVTAPW
jgi:hypothetical protein